MAKAKSKSKSKPKSKSKAIKAPNLPNGYKAIGRAPNWDVDKHPVLEGVRGATQEVTFDKGTRQERTQRLCIVDDKVNGPTTLWEAAMLRDFFDQTEEGDMVRVEFLGLGEAKKGQEAPKLFSTGKK